MCRRSSAALTPVKYEWDSKNVTGTFARKKIVLTEKLVNGALSTPTLDFSVFKAQLGEVHSIVPHVYGVQEILQECKPSIFGNLSCDAICSSLLYVIKIHYHFCCYQWE